MIRPELTPEQKSKAETDIKAIIKEAGFDSNNYHFYWTGRTRQPMIEPSLPKLDARLKDKYLTVINRLQH